MLRSDIVGPGLAAVALSLAVPAGADAPYWQCATFARSFSGIPIYGDAHTWWSQAEGRFARGTTPTVGAVMAFVPSHGMRLGHVATVTRLTSSREITVTHANWSPIDGQRGRIERDVRVRDVSFANDWSSVRVWFAPIGDLGSTAWPVAGFIYGAAPQPDLPHLRYADLSKFNPAPRLRPIGRDIVRLAQIEERTSGSARR